MFQKGLTWLECFNYISESPFLSNIYHISLRNTIWRRSCKTSLVSWVDGRNLDRNITHYIFHDLTSGHTLVLWYPVIQHWYLFYKSPESPRRKWAVSLSIDDAFSDRQVWDRCHHWKQLPKEKWKYECNRDSYGTSYLVYLECFVKMG